MLDYLLHLTLTLALVIISCLSLEGKHALARYRNIISPTAIVNAICIICTHALVKTCPHTEDSAEILKSTFVCAIKCNVTGPEVLLSTRIKEFALILFVYFEAMQNLLLDEKVLFKHLLQLLFLNNAASFLSGTTTIAFVTRAPSEKAECWMFL